MHDCDVVLVEDIVDTGLTCAYVLETLRGRGPRSLAVCALLDRRSRRIVPVPLRFVGFEATDELSDRARARSVRQVSQPGSCRRGRFVGASSRSRRIRLAVVRPTGRATGYPVRRYLAGMVEVRLSAVRVDLQSNTPVLLLMEIEGIGRTLPIFIGAPEATAIAFALQGVPTPRPMTHDLLQDLLDTLDVKLERILITELRSATYFAELHLVRGTQTLSVSSRPSDAVALAVRTGSPLFVADDLMDAEGVLLPSDDEDEDADDANPDALVGEFREFLDTVRPEDFSS